MKGLFDILREWLDENPKELIVSLLTLPIYLFLGWVCVVFLIIMLG